MADRPRICILGGSGRAGAYIAARAVAEGFATTAIVAPGDLAGLPPMPIELFEGDLRQPGFVGAVMSDADILVIALPPGSLVRDVARIVAQRPEAQRLRAIIQISQWGADSRNRDPVGLAHAEAVETFRTLPAAHFNLRCSLFAEQFVELVADSVAMFAETWLPVGDGRIAPVSCIEIADLVASIASHPNHDSSDIFDVSGPQSFTQTEIADLIASILKRPIRYVEQSNTKWSRLARLAGFQDDVISHLLIAARVIKAGAFDVTGISGWSLPIAPVPLERVLRNEAFALTRGRKYIGYWFRREVVDVQEELG